MLAYFLAVLKNKNVIIINFFIAALLASVYVFGIVKKEYKAQLTFLPPSNESDGLGSVLGISFSPLVKSTASPDQVETLFASRSIKRKIIHKFDLYKAYNLEESRNKFELALKEMQKKIYLESNAKGSIAFEKTLSYSISCFHTSPDTVYQMANYTFSLLDSAMRDVSIDRARRDRIFVEQQLEKSKKQLQDLQLRFHQFQVENKAYDLPEQIKSTLRTYADLKSALILNDLRIDVALREYQESTPEILELRRKKQIYQQKLQSLENSKTPDVLPSLDLSSEMMSDYLELVRDVEVQNQVNMLLVKEFEQAKIQEAKNVSPLIVVDPAYIPEYKARPKRLLMVGIIVTLYMTVIFIFVILREIYLIHIRDSDFLNVIKMALGGKASSVPIAHAKKKVSEAQEEHVK